MARKKKNNVVVGLSAEEARLQHEAVVAAQAETAKVAAGIAPEEDKETAEQEHIKKAEKQAKRQKKMEAAQKKEAARLKAIKKLHEDDELLEEARKPKRVRKYETVKVKVPYDRTIMNFTTPELLELFGGWFTLTYAFSKPARPDMLNPDGTPIMRDYYICSRDVSAIPPSERPKKNAAIKKLFDRDVYGYAIIAPASAFGGKDKDKEED